MTYTHVIDALKDMKKFDHEVWYDDDLDRVLDCAIVLVSKMKRIHKVVNDPNGTLYNVKLIVMEE